MTLEKKEYKKNKKADCLLPSVFDYEKHYKGTWLYIARKLGIIAPCNIPTNTNKNTYYRASLYLCKTLINKNENEAVNEFLKQRSMVQDIINNKWKHKEKKVKD